ncbi:AcrR family transcriptional regulator [Diaminobutyricimonas aerilata]|uniref:AcrR family transcriptional regulator n=1 Tax=Diaminobutyricimonas aerilata TaxID=1162967 RepID=A0A2M9CM74_9MICO|nr:TetR/AcrR family transcriptional regulator [Diaminobutyricimonas aerilata]PJJ72986.1 AcrR family transcriptional regulator [Diaminobutyricimonas aerilata]
MGLRTIKAQRTREAIIDIAIDLFENQGYDQTTMEQIAEGAEVGISTLYRYFPSKELIVLAPIMAGIGGLAAALHARPQREDLAIALGHALHEVLDQDESSEQRLLVLRAILDRSTGPRARLWDLWHQERSLLEEAIAARTGAEVSEPWVAITAHTTMTVLQMALDQWRSEVPRRHPAEIADELIRVYQSGSIVIPRLP